ncbi:coiled-coil domain-containing protein 130 homolog [Coccinella septempunctata]|uniref:coiled-coil domain-containing protein 130 homolog n=1 Tax=Coccinella septempunctata TaxID=41139 RepID=UPI001D0678F8|nr:coiled-coil domain-containing protein 130 homolog [Coccinella septempunctata]
MGERKGTNKYYPPDYNPKVGGLNKFLGTHALRERARKIHQGIIIIRFEMPYNIWCEGCNNHIGMGVRYNAEKTKAGMYYTTPVYQFKMKCHLCDNHFVIKTDPANLDYLIISGARRQENRWDPLQNEQVVPETKETQKRLFDDSMFKLEHGSQDLSAAESAKPRLVQLFDRNESLWSDSYSANQRLRQVFREKSKELKSSAAQDRALLEKSSLDIPLVSETAEDRKMASLLSKKYEAPNATETTELIRQNLISSPCLPSSFTPAKEKKALKALSEGKLKMSNLVKRKNNDSQQSKKKTESESKEEEILDSKIVNNDEQNEESENKKQKVTSLVGDYGSGTDSD